MFSRHYPSVRASAPMERYLRIANSTPMKEDFAEPVPSKNMVSLQKEPETSNSYLRRLDHLCGTKSEPKNVSLVQELDAQYKTLLNKYEQLLQSIDSERGSSTVVSGTSRSSDDNSSPTTGSSKTDNSCKNLTKSISPEAVPEYKLLFREIFSLINDAKA